jgi:N-methylhydantoinase A/oxoprolinase/acetone carboxylase beta subunit
VLGRLDPEGLLSGAMPLDAGAAPEAISDTIASALDVTVERAALGAVELCVANVMRAVESMTVAQGRDPRDFALIGAGGAGPLIACEVAAALDIGEVVVPPWPGNFSACGLLTSDARRDWTKTHIVPAAAERLGHVGEQLSEMESAAREWLAATAVPGSGPILLRSVAARHVGQDYELEVALPSGELSPESLEETLISFHDAHERRYGYALPDQSVEFVDLKVTAIQRLPASLDQGDSLDSLDTEEGRGHETPATPPARQVYLSEREGWVEVPVRDRGQLQAGDSIAGPAVVQQYDSTTYLPPGFRATADQHGNLRVRASEGP